MVDTVLPIANGFYTSDSLPVSAQNCVNWYPHINEAPALNQEILFGTPGLGGQIDTSIVGVSRGARSFNNDVYFVIGTTLAKVDTEDTVTNIGSITGTGLVSMANNNTQLMILNSTGDGWIYDRLLDTLEPIIDTDFDTNGVPQYVTFIDGYFVCTTDENGKFISSAINDGMSWNALDFGTAESSPDAAIVPVVARNQLYIVGALTTEQQSNVPNGAAFPFQRSGLFLPKGTAAPFSVVQYADTFAFIGRGVGESLAVWAVDGNSIVKKSTSAIDTLLQAIADDDLASIFSWSYSQGGHTFVGFGLPDTTIVYDASTERWHERSSRILSGGVYVNVPSRAATYTVLGNDILVTDTIDGRIGFASLSTFTEYDMEIVRTFTTQPYQNNMQPFFVPKLELTVESGVGLIEGSAENAVNPTVRLRISRDGGKTWGEWRSRPIGAMGEYSCRAVWRRNNRCGRFDVYQFAMSDPVKPVCIQLTGQIEAADDAAA
jgi:hypothetical protein